MSVHSHFQVLYCLAYVLPLHTNPSTRPSLNRNRDHPATIQARIRAVSLSTAFCSLCTLIILYLHASNESRTLSPWTLMGYWPVGLVQTIKAVLLTTLLFAAPLYEALFIDGCWQDWARLQPLKDLWTQWTSWRNYVAVCIDPFFHSSPFVVILTPSQGPVTEECLFRSAGVPLLLIAGVPITRTILLSPVVFGLAHIHHFYEFRITNPQIPLPMAIARTILQLSYTSLFGIYGTFLFIRTGSLLAVILVHSFCNSMGLPRVWGRVEPWWTSQEEANGSVGTRLTVVYYVLLFAGAAAWYRALLPLTDNALALASF